MAELKLPKLMTRVRFPSPAPEKCKRPTHQAAPQKSDEAGRFEGAVFISKHSLAFRLKIIDNDKANTSGVSCPRASLLQGIGWKNRAQPVTKPICRKTADPETGMARFNVAGESFFCPVFGGHSTINSYFSPERQRYGCSSPTNAACYFRIMPN